MKKVGFYVVTLLALIGAGVAHSAASPGAKLQKQDRVYGGGQFGPGCFSNSTMCFARARNLSVDAHAEGNGADSAGNVNYGVPGVTFEDRDRVTCVRVEGNHAVIGGVVASGTKSGYGFVWYTVDRGGAGGTQRDLASPEFIDVLSSTSWPAGFPDVCPSPVTGAPGLEPIYQELHSGDLVVQDAPDS